MELPRPPAAVTFDCWSTLIQDVDWDAAVLGRRDTLVRIAGERGVELDPEKAMELIEGSWREHVAAWRRGEMFGAHGAALWVLQQLDLESGGSAYSIDSELAATLADALSNVTSEVGTNVVEGAPEALRLLRERGIPTALICDTGFTPSDRVRVFLEQHGLELDHYFFSDEVGVPKPYPPIFKAALLATGAEPAKAIHIGDLRRTDIAGARNAGMATIRFTGVHDDGWEPDDVAGEEADAVLKHWKDFPELIGL